MDRGKSGTQTPEETTQENFRERVHPSTCSIDMNEETAKQWDSPLLSPNSSSVHERPPDSSALQGEQDGGMAR